jgi:GTP-binding protein HflX
MRGLTLPDGRKIILSDTVGFIADLPTELVAAFRATLEEVLEADIVLHVRDVAHEDSAAQKEDVLKILDSLGVKDNGERPLIEVLNKIDLLDPDIASGYLTRNRMRGGAAIAVSALTGEGTDTLMSRIGELLAGAEQIFTLRLGPEDGEGLAWTYAHGRVLERRDGERGTVLRVAADAPVFARFRSRFGDKRITEENQSPVRFSSVRT